MHRLSILIAGFAIALSSACVTAPKSAEPAKPGIAAFKKDVRLGNQTSNVCFASQIGDLRGMSKDTIIVKSGLGDEFIIEVTQDCQTLQSALSLSMESGFSCLSDFDKIIIDNAEKCTVQSMHRWNENVDPVDLQGIRPEDIEPIMEPLK